MDVEKVSICEKMIFNRTTHTHTHTPSTWNMPVGKDYQNRMVLSTHRWQFLYHVL